MKWIKEINKLHHKVGKKKINVCLSKLLVNVRRYVRKEKKNILKIVQKMLKSNEDRTNYYEDRELSQLKEENRKKERVYMETQERDKVIKQEKRENKNSIVNGENDN